jgi:hypothetical protein
MSYIPKKYLLIKWPESQRIMTHPQALHVSTSLNNDEPSYIIPPEIWERYKNSYYNFECITDDNKKTEMCIECNEYRSQVHITYCDKCYNPICDNCYELARRGVRCYNCKLGEIRTPPD